MRHEIPVESLGPQGKHMADAVDACVHCGFCLPTCPTYVTMGEEMDSPRGRIVLMKQTLEGELDLAEAMPFIDNCLGCQACETACPSGVRYGELITPFRAYAELHRSRPPLDKGRRMMVLRMLPYPRRFRLAARMGSLARPLARFMPRSLATMLELLPEKVPAAQPLPEVNAAAGTRRARVALLAGCAQQVLDPDINQATLRVLAENGVEVVTPKRQGCCGALSMHTGDREHALKLARHNLDAFPADVDAIITTAAGCGSGMREYGSFFAGEPDAERAAELAGKVVDVSVFLADLGLSKPPPAAGEPTRIAYQDACHLAHAQGVRVEPRSLLEAIGNVEVVTPQEWELCCGSAGTYNIERPDTAHELGERKASNLIATGARMVASGNIGCLTQVTTHLREQGEEIPVLHTMQILDRAYRGLL